MEKRRVFSKELDKYGIPELLYEMANLSKKDTGIDYVIHIRSGGDLGGGKKLNHGPSIKVSLSKSRFDSINNVSVSISKNPEIIYPKNKILKDFFSSQDSEKIKGFIKMNYDLLMNYWNDNGIVISYILDNIKKV